MGSKLNWTDEEREEIVRWISLALIDRKAAAHLIEANLFGIVAYHLQQTAEKLLKAFLLANRVKIEKTHDIQKLLLTAIPLDSALIRIDKIGVGSARMTDFATEYRYPNPRGNDLGDLDEVKGGLEYVDALYKHLKPFFGDSPVCAALSYNDIDEDPFEDSSMEIVTNSLKSVLKNNVEQKP